MVLPISLSGILLSWPVRKYFGRSGNRRGMGARYIALSPHRSAHIASIALRAPRSSPSTVLFETEFLPSIAIARLISSATAGLFTSVRMVDASIFGSDRA